jgi:hypothetical protein
MYMVYGGVTVTSVARVARAPRALSGLSGLLGFPGLNEPNEPNEPNILSNHTDLGQTNNSSITSKRSVERLYSHEDEQQFLRYFVKKPQRRSPIVSNLQGRGVYIHHLMHSCCRSIVDTGFGCTLSNM